VKRHKTISLVKEKNNNNNYYYYYSQALNKFFGKFYKVCEQEI